MNTITCFILGSLLIAGSVQLACTRSTPISTSVRKAATGSPVLLTDAEISNLRRNKVKYGAFIKAMTAKLDYQPVPVAIFGPDEHYTKTGVNTSVNNAEQLAADSEVAYRAGMAYVMTGDALFATTAQRIIDAWATTLKQITTVQGNGDINFNMPYLIAAASWTRNANQWNSGPFNEFLRKTVLPVSQSSRHGNHGLWGALMEASAGAYLGDAAMLTKTRERWEVLMKEQVTADGSMPQEMERSATTNWRGGPDKGIRGMAYTHYALMPASLTAKIFADQGQPVWQSDGGKLLKSAYDRAAAWTLHPETFPYYASNNGKLQGVRDAAYFVLLLPYYPNKDAAAVVAQGNLGLNGFMLVEMFGKR